MRSDEQLMYAFQQGNVEAFELLVDRWYAPALAYANAITKDVQLSEDIVQECFALLYIKRSQFSVELSFAAYIRALLYHKSIDHIRRQRKAPVPLPDESVSVDTGSPEYMLIRSTFYDSLQSAINALTDSHRALLIAYALEGKSYRELAQMFHKSVPQIKITLHRIRKQLKHIKEEWS